jgi:hypothetical protein
MSTNSEPTKTTDNAESRISIIEAIKTPLAFFTLVVLVVEAIMGLTIGITSGLDKSMLIVGMISLIFLLVGVVAFMAIKHPAALYLYNPNNIVNPVAPVGAEEYLLLCHIYDDRSNWGKVQTYAASCIDINKKDPNGWYYLGRASGGVSDFNKAIECYKKSLEFGGPYSPSWAWYQLAWIYNQRGQFKEAEEAAKNAIKLDDTYIDAWKELGLASAKLGKHKQAKEANARVDMVKLDHLPIDLKEQTGISLS